MRRKRKLWTLPEPEARSMLQQIEEKIRAGNIDVRHRDVLVRLRSIIEDDLVSDAGRAGENRQSDGL